VELETKAVEPSGKARRLIELHRTDAPPFAWLRASRETSAKTLEKDEQQAYAGRRSAPSPVLEL